MNDTYGLLAGLAQAGSITALRGLLPEVVPWVVSLPSEDIETLLTELTDTAHNEADPDNLAPIAVLLAQWKRSAEIHADPALHARLACEPEGDLGPVPVPELAD
ncbi:hypothetical protein [Kitasatospora sp. NPDC096140]|uniref:hypothetical protein n=1 Tax=unclassified Kitasatospora TaxID=2633591 RepID=UPI00331D2BF0